MKKTYLVGILILVIGAIGVLSLSQKEEKKPGETVVQTAPKEEAPPTPIAEDLPITMNPTQEVTELKIEDTKIGEGGKVKSGDTVVMHYSGTLLSGSKFDSSYDRGTPFETTIGVGRVIKGWDQGVPGMKVGGKRKLTIPSDLAYGARGAGSAIPPNAALIFEVELLEIK